MSTVNYHASPTVAAFMRDESFIRGLMGPFGSGKSVGCIMELVRRATMQAPARDGIRRTRFAVVRNTYPELRDTTRKSFEEWVPARLGEWSEAEFIFTMKFNDVEAEFLFRALDRPEHVKKLLSLELTGAWINEAREVPHTVFKTLVGRLDRYPSRRDGVGPTWTGLIFDTNPPDDDSWIYRLCEEEKPTNVRLFKQPGGRTPLAENLGHWETRKRGEVVGYYPEPNPGGDVIWVNHLGPKYYENLAITNASDPTWIKVHIDAQYGPTNAGRPVYPEWQDHVHVQEPSKLDSRAPLLLGMDFGLTPALAFAQRDPSDGQLQVIDEMVAEDLGASRFAEDAAMYIRRAYPGRQVAGHGDPAGEQRAQTDERTAFDIVQGHGIPIHPAPTNDFTLRREAVGRALSRLTLRGRPALVVSPKCKKLRKAMNGGYHYRRVAAAGDDRFRDAPDKNEYSHIAEALQYLAVGEGLDSQVLEPITERRNVQSKFKTKRMGVRRRM